MEIPTEYIVGLGGTLISISAATWAYIRSQHTAIISRVDNQAERLEGKLDDCEKRHLERDKTHFDLAIKVGELKGVNEVASEFKQVVVDAMHEVKKS